MDHAVRMGILQSAANFPVDLERRTDGKLLFPIKSLP
jgi:hypothetical protein